VDQDSARQGPDLEPHPDRREIRETVARRRKARLAVDRELEIGSLAHYSDADYYTSSYRRRIDDVQFYVGLAQRFGGPVLEYGIGNGRIALPMARHGIDVVGVDHSRPMLEDLETRVAAEPELRTHIRWRRGDMRKLRLGRRFPLVICPFNAAMHLYTRGDVERFLASVLAHLRPRGLFVVDLAVPSLVDLLRRPERTCPAPRFRHPTTGEVVSYRERYDYDAIRQIMFVTSEFEPVGHPDRSWAVPLSHRQFFPQEWEALLHYAGFRIERVEGDFHGGPLGRASDVMVWYARRKG
jgi:SAM-dependent methyltransferase